MSQHKATICWSASTPEYMSGKYSREHTWTFDGGLSVPASSSPAVVRVPLSNPANVDPEEAYVASLSSCHMLTFLHVARLAGFHVDRYDDEAVGEMAKPLRLARNRYVSRWQLDSDATNASSGSIAAGSDNGTGTAWGDDDAGTSTPPSKVQRCARG